MSNKKFKILLVQPAQILDNGKIFKCASIAVPPPSLPMVAAITPKDFDVHIVDEYVDDINFDFTADIVGITAKSLHAPRAYQIAQEFKKRGKIVVMGGFHASFMPEEAKQYVDSVIIGEAENIWPQFLKDFKKNQIKEFYQDKDRVDLANLPLPKIELLNLKKYNTYVRPVQISRGCIFGCEYCSACIFYKHQIKYRPIKNVIEEIKVKKYRYIFFTDDNLTLDLDYTKDLLLALKPLNIQWSSQTSLHFAQKSDLLKLAKESGCVFLGFGLESIDQQSLSSVNKNHNQVDKYKEAIENVKKHKIGVGLFTIYGFDHDTKDVFNNTLKYLRELEVLNCYFNILTPLPQTPLYKKLKQQDRIITYDWSKYDCQHCAFIPKNMTPLELEAGKKQMIAKYNSFFGILKRALFASNRQFLHNIFVIIVVMNRVNNILFPFLFSLIKLNRMKKDMIFKSKLFINTKVLISKPRHDENI